jgi:hypothetical protein
MGACDVTRTPGCENTPGGVLHVAKQRAARLTRLEEGPSNLDHIDE